MRVLHLSAVAVLIAVLCVTETSGATKSQLDVILPWLKSDNKFLQNKAVSMILGAVRKKILQNMAAFKSSVIPMLNATAPLLAYPGAKEVMKELLPLLMHYGQPKMLALLNDEKFQNTTFELIDQFHAALQNKTGIDEHHPGESLKIIFRRVDWTKIVEKSKHLLNLPELLRNELLLEILGDFIPKEVILKYLPVLEKLMARSEHMMDDEAITNALGFLKNDLYNANLTDLSDDFFSNVKLIVSQIDWLPILRSLKPVMLRTLAKIPKFNDTSVLAAMDDLLDGILNANYSVLTDDRIDNAFAIASQVRWAPIIKGLQPLFESSTSSLGPKLSKIARKTIQLIKEQYAMENITSPFKSIAKSIFHKYLSIVSRVNASSYISKPENGSQQCHRDLMYTLENTLMLKKWAMEMLDAYGKLGSGIMRGKLHFMGSYEQCHGVRAMEYSSPNDTIGTQRFGGHYCRLMVDIDKKLMEKLSKRKSPMQLTFAWGVCMPDTCSSEDVRGYLPAEALKSWGFPIADVYCGEKPHLAHDPPAIVAIIIIVIIIVFMVIGTVFDLVMKCKEDGDFTSEDKSVIYSVPRQSGDEYELATLRSNNDKNLYRKDSTKKPLVVDDEYAVLRADTHSEDEKVNACVMLIRNASIITNLQRLLSRRTSSGTIRCMHGMRVFSMSWIILVSTYYFAVHSDIHIPLTENLLDAKKLMQRFVVQLVTSGPLAIDTFFVLGATLASFWMLKRLEHDVTVKGSRIVQYITHRLIRIVPMYMIVLMAFAALYLYNGHGPLWFREQPAAENCQKNWWTNLLFINNVVNNDEMCMPWSWYLANDMQYYLIGLIFIVLIYKMPKIGMIATAALGSIGIISTAAIEQQGAGGLLVKPSNENMNFKQDVWMAPWCRVTPYAIGLILGYILYKTKKFRYGKLFFFGGWIVTLTVGLGITFLPYSEMGKGRLPWSQSQRTAFESLSHTLWALCVSFVIFACHMGYGGYVNRFLSWTIWVPLSRVTFAAYLVHPVMMVLYVYTRMQLVYLADLALLYMFIGHWVMTYVLSFLLTACVEMPFRQVERVFIRSRSSCCHRS